REVRKFERLRENVVSYQGVPNGVQLVEAQLRDPPERTHHCQCPSTRRECPRDNRRCVTCSTPSRELVLALKICLEAPDGYRKNTELLCRCQWQWFLLRPRRSIRRIPWRLIAFAEFKKEKRQRHGPASAALFSNSCARIEVHAGG